MRKKAKKLMLLMLTVCMACPMISGCSKGTAPYYVRSPYNDESSQIGKFDNLSEAKKAADEKKEYGYVVFDSEGEFIYAPGETLISAKLLYEAKIITDHIRDNGYTYGDCSINPALTVGMESCEKLVSCDRLVGWALYNAGYKEGQPTAHGLTSGLIPFMVERGFEKIDDPDDLLPGDVIYVGYEGQPEPYGHVFLYAGKGPDGNHYRYDGGSTTRIQSTQPSLEPLSYEPNRIFICAYRAPDAD